ncbi:MAG: sugar phosphate isomerase/epimerase [Thermoplasmata archaeon]|nr:MAG: sugar phosphate isomerase/epimerase [Thermoplasmata archaeon]
MRYGVKAALKDAHVMANLDVDLLEVHLGLEDLPRHRRGLVDTFKEVRREHGHDLLVHAPEFMMTGAGPALVDPTSEDEAIMSLTKSALQATVDLAQELEAMLIVMHPGGIVPDATSPSQGERMERLKVALASTRDLSREAGVSLTVENMPWFYHVKPMGGGQPLRWESSLMVTADDMDQLAPFVDGMTLDVSHGYLHSRKGGMEVIEGFISRHRDRILHMHLADALPPDHEGLQVGEGSVDFHTVLAHFAGRDVTAVPEIIGGHMGGGLSFKRALEELRRIESALR